MPNMEQPVDGFARTFSKEDISLMQKLLDWVIKYGKKIIIITEALVLLSLFAKFSLTRSVNAVNFKIEDLKAELMAAKEREDEYNKIIEDINLIKEIDTNRVDLDFLISKSKEHVPTEMTLTSTSYDKESAKIVANVKTIEGFAFFINEILNDASIDRILLTDSDYDKSKGLYSISIIVFIKNDNSK